MRKFDPTRRALYRPGDDTVFFGHGRPASDAGLCAEMSRLAYCRDRDLIARSLERAGQVEHTVIDRGESEALIAEFEDVAVLAFRGTESRNPRDLITDIQFQLTPWYRGGRVHSGFAAALERVWPEIEPVMRIPVPRLLLTGHSLGAALATLAASRYPGAEVFTFGSPRVGDAGFRESLSNVSIRRYVGCCDVVCRVPLAPYVHVGVHRYINRAGTVVVESDRSVIAADRWAARVSYAVHHGWRLTTNVAFRGLADHAPINYVHALSAT